MRYSKESAELFVPDGKKTELAPSGKIHPGISPHQDDFEIMAIDGILRCDHEQGNWFTGIVVTGGSSSPREDLYDDYSCSDEELHIVRNQEQKTVAVIGDYAAQFFLDHPSSAVIDSDNRGPCRHIASIIRQTEADVVYAHNLADKHPSQTAITLRAIEPIQSLPPVTRPMKLIGFEERRDLDSTMAYDEVACDCLHLASLQTALVEGFDSQIDVGKRYDLAALDRRRPNATYFTTQGVGVTSGLSFAMEISPLVESDDLDISHYDHSFVERFSNSVKESIEAIQYIPRREQVRS
ncbi:MAG: PIG-L family deacetylase [Candidatus Promineifilaceae bacterium]